MGETRVAPLERRDVRMRRLISLCVGLALLAGSAAMADTRAPIVAPCATRPGVLGLSRIVEVDTSGGPIFGRAARGHDFLADGEIVLTFDDGPSRAHTRPVLKALADECTKATFFMVGRMAVADPAMVREVAAQGHTVGSHTWSHAKLSALPADKAEQEVELGLSAVAGALEGTAAPFFRFPYLRPNAGAVDYLKRRDIASFTIDVDSRDFRTRDPEEVRKNVLTQLAGRHKGILLFHDIQPSTAHALPGLLAELRKRGFKVVHMVPKAAARTLPEYDEQAGKLLARKLAAAKTPLATRAVTWQQSRAGESEVLPWAAPQSSTGTIANEDTTATWYKQWLVP